MNATRDLHRLLDRSLGEDPHDALLATRLLADELTGWVTDRNVLASRRAGKSWTKIARVLQVSRQAAHRRFAHLDRISSVGDLPRRARPTSVAAQSEAIAERLAHRGIAEQRFQQWESEGDVVPW